MLAMTPGVGTACVVYAMGHGMPCHAMPCHANAAPGVLVPNLRAAVAEAGDIVRVAAEGLLLRDLTLERAEVVVDHLPDNLVVLHGVVGGGKVAAVDGGELGRQVRGREWRRLGGDGDGDGDTMLVAKER